MKITKRALYAAFICECEYVTPLIINIDAHTALYHDREFCKRYNVKLANFSFIYVLTIWVKYWKMVSSKRMYEPVYVNGPCYQEYIEHISESTSQTRQIIKCTNHYGSNRFLKKDAHCLI